MIHAHGADDPNNIDEEFSDADIRNFVGINKYVVTPSGRLIYREPNAWIDGEHESFPGFVVVGSGAGIYSGVYVDG